jgi:hypothetical protein
MTPEDATSLHALVQIFQARRGRTVVLIADDEDQDQDAPREHRGPPRPAVIIPFPEAKGSGSDRRR